MKQLSGTDNLFLHFEKGNAYMHVASLAIYDPSTAPGGKVRFRDILRFMAGRIRAVPLFRRRLVTVPLSVDRPYWVEEPNIDVEYHVRHIALPHPGDWRQLCIQVARIHSRPLDRSKPMWEIYVIEGLDNIEGLPAGSFALYSKFHHASVDGEAGTEILKAMHALTPEAEDEEGPATVYAEREPTAVELYARALANTAKRVPELARFSAAAARRAAQFGAGYVGNFSVERLEEIGRELLGAVGTGLLPRPPVTRFNAPISAHRVVEAIDIQMSDIKAIRQQVEGVTVNDVFMAVVGGALHRYLEDKGELPAESLTAMVPMTLRGAEKAEDVGNQVGFTVMPVHSELVDPVARLEAVRDSGQAAKRVVGLLGKDIAASAYNLLPTALSELLSRHVVLPTMNIVVSNVRGPDYPLYMAGARLVRFLPISIAFDGLGLNVTGFSISGTMWICAVACREMMPDPAFFADCLRRSFDELRQAVNARAAAAEPRPRRAAARHAAARKPSTKATRSRRTAKKSAPG